MSDYQKEQIKSAAKQGDLAELKLLAKEVDISQSYIGFKALISAAEGGSVDVVRWLLLDLAIDPNIKDATGETAVHIASYNNNLEVVKLLTERGAKIDVKDNEGYTALHQAAWGNNVDIAIWLLDQGADINDTNNMGETPLYTASEWGKLAMVKTLVLKGANITIQNKKGYTPAVIANINKYNEVKKLLTAVSQRQTTSDFSDYSNPPTPFPMSPMTLDLLLDDVPLTPLTADEVIDSVNMKNNSYEQEDTAQVQDTHGPRKSNHSTRFNSNKAVTVSNKKSEKDLEIERLKALLKEKDQTIAIKKQKLSEKGDKLKTKENIISNKEAKINDLHQEIEEKDTEIANKNEIIASKKRKHSAKENESDKIIAQKTMKLHDKDKAIAERDRTIAKKGKLLKDKDEKIQDCDNRIASKGKRIYEQEQTIELHQKEQNYIKDQLIKVQGQYISLSEKQQSAAREIQEHSDPNPQKNANEVSSDIGFEKFAHSADYKLDKADHENIIQLMRYTCLIRYPTLDHDSTGTGVFLGLMEMGSPNNQISSVACVLTSWHLLENWDFNNSDAEIIFDLYKPYSSNCQTYKIDGVIIHNEQLDYALLYISDKNLLNRFQTKTSVIRDSIKDSIPPADTVMVLLGHPDSRHQQVDQLHIVNSSKILNHPDVKHAMQVSKFGQRIGCNLHFLEDNFRLFYNCSSFHGASGGPCFRVKNGLFQFVCIHAGGILLKKNFANPGTVTDYECGILMTHILNDINNKLPSMYLQWAN